MERRELTGGGEDSTGRTRTREREEGESEVKERVDKKGDSHNQARGEAEPKRLNTAWGYDLIIGSYLRTGVS